MNTSPPLTVTPSGVIKPLSPPVPKPQPGDDWSTPEKLPRPQVRRVGPQRADVVKRIKVLP